METDCGISDGEVGFYSALGEKPATSFLVRAVPWMEGAVIVRYKGGKSETSGARRLCHMPNIAVDERRAKHRRTKYRKEVSTLACKCVGGADHESSSRKLQEDKTKSHAVLGKLPLARGGFWSRRSGFTSDVRRY